MTLNKHLKATFIVAFPILLAQLGKIALNWVDGTLVGQLGISAKASVSLATAIYTPFSMILIGFSLILHPLISSAKVEGKDSVAHIFKHGTVLTMGATCFFMIIYFFLASYLIELKAFKQSPEEIIEAKKYLYIAILGFIPLMVFEVFRGLTEGLAYTKLTMIAILTSNVVNIGFHYLFIQTLDWGIAGASISSFISKTLLMVFIVIISYKHEYVRSCLNRIKWGAGYSIAKFKELLSLAIPMSLQLLLKVLAFSILVYICGYGGRKEDLSAYFIATGLGSMTFLIYKAFGTATTIRLGSYYVTQDKEEMKKVFISSLLLVLSVAVVFSLVCYFFGEYLAIHYVSSRKIEGNVLALVSGMLFIIAITQIFDALQIFIIGALNGIRDILVPTVIIIISYWIISISISYYLSIVLNMGVKGVMIGFLSGVFVSSILLFYRFIFKLRN